MGSPSDEAQRDKDEVQHEVVFTRGFFMAETECTQAQWEAVKPTNPSHGKAPDQPVNQVSWPEAQEYCRALTRRHREAGLISDGWEWDLPTEAQWEYACRAGTTGSFAGDLNALAWIESNSEGKAHAVKTRGPNAWGLHDLHGNVWEWCRDWYGDYPTNAVHDPTGPSAGTFRSGFGGGRVVSERFSGRYPGSLGPSGFPMPGRGQRAIRDRTGPCRISTPKGPAAAGFRRRLRPGQRAPSSSRRSGRP
jgi:formylglycine-generating enzyme required for sulfatase activity